MPKFQETLKTAWKTYKDGKVAASRKDINRGIFLPATIGEHLTEKCKYFDKILVK